MDRKKIMLTNREIMMVRTAIWADIRHKEEVIKILKEDGRYCESILYDDIETLKTVMEKLDHALFGKKVSI